MAEFLSDADIGLGEVAPTAPTQKQPIVQRKTSALPKNNVAGLLTDSDIGLGDGTPPAMGQIVAVAGQNGAPISTPMPGQKPAKPLPASEVKTHLEEFWDTLKTFDIREGIAGRAATSAYKMATGQKGEAKPETPEISIGESLKRLKDYAVEHPGATVGEFVKAIGEDPWMLFLPELGMGTKLAQVSARIASKVGTTAEKVAAVTAKAIGTGTEMAAVGAGTEAGAQALEKGAGVRQKINWSEVGTSAAMWGGMGALTSFLRKNPALADRVKKDPAAIDEIIGAYERAEPGSGVTQQHVQEAINKIKRGMSDGEVAAEQKAYDLMQSGASKKEVEAARKRNPKVGEFLDEMMKQREYWTRESGMARGEQLMGPAEPSAFRAPQGPAIGQGPGDTPFGARQPQLPPPEPPALPGAEFGTPQLPGGPKTPPRLPSGQQGQVDPDLLKKIAIASGAGVAGTYAYTHPDQIKDMAAAAGLAGAALITKGKAVDALQPVSAMAALLRGTKYTLKTFERLPQNRTEYPRKMVEEQLRRSDVSQAEKDVIIRILDNNPGDTVTANDLVSGFKLATADHTLERAPVDQYATYGLEQLNLKSAGNRGIPVENLEATTNLYRLPPNIIVSAKNHFNDPRLYGWTRSYRDPQTGTRTVVEIQSDLAQHAKEIAPERRAQLEESLPNVLEQRELTRQFLMGERSDPMTTIRELQKYNPDVAMKIAEKIGVDPNLPDVMGALQQYFNEHVGKNPNSDRFIKQEFGRALSIYMQELNLLRTEQMAALEGGRAAEQVAPILKNWYRRLVREELGNARESGESTVRFGTADTVAKVEQWPEPRRAVEDRIAVLEGKLYRAEMGQTSSSGLRPDVEATRIRELLDHERQILEGLSDEMRFQPQHQGIYNRYKNEVEKYLKSLGGRLIQDADGNTFYEVPVSKDSAGITYMYGNMDPKLLKPMAIMGLGYLMGSTLAEDNKVLAGIMGAGAAAMLPKLLSRSIGDMDYIGGVLSTRMRNISPKLADRVANDYERNVLKKTHDALISVDPFLRRVAGLDKSEQNQLASAIFTGDKKATADILRKIGDPDLAKEWVNVRGVLDGIGKDLKQVGRLEGMREEYFPRVVNDLEGLRDFLGAEHREGLDRVLNEARRKAAQAGTVLTGIEESKIINKYLMTHPSQGKPGFTKGRKLGEIGEDLLQFYDSPTESLYKYIHSAVADAEKARLFGKHLQTKDGVMQLDDSIGGLVRDEMAAGRLTEDQADKLAALLRSRFGPGEKGASPAMQGIKNVVYAGLLGNFKAALTQVGDIPLSITLHGFNPVFSAIAQRIRGRQQVKASDFGLVDHISEEFANPDKTAKWLNRLYKGALFSGTDLFAKDVTLGASLIKNQKLAATKAGQEQLAAKWGHRMSPEEMQMLYSDLQAGRLTDDVRALLWSDLTKLQPVSRSEVPQAYLDHPNGRMLYMLKTYTLKQFDYMRNSAYNEIRAGRVKEGVTNLAKYTALMTASGVSIAAVKNYIEGKPFDLAPAAMDNLLKTFGWSQYMVDQAKEGKPAKAIAGAIAPPYQMIDDIVSRDPKALRYIPLVGPWVEAHLGGGAERAEKKAKREENRRLREAGIQ